MLKVPLEKKIMAFEKDLQAAIDAYAKRVAAALRRGKFHEDRLLTSVDHVEFSDVYAIKFTDKNGKWAVFNAQNEIVQMQESFISLAERVELFRKEDHKCEVIHDDCFKKLLARYKALYLDMANYLEDHLSESGWSRAKYLPNMNKDLAKAIKGFLDFDETRFNIELLINQINQNWIITKPNTYFSSFDSMMEFINDQCCDGTTFDKDRVIFKTADGRTPVEKDHLIMRIVEYKPSKKRARESDFNCCQCLDS